MQRKIESCTKDLRPLRGSQDTQTLNTRLKIAGQWYNLRRDHRNLYNKVVDLELNGNTAKFATPQTPPAPTRRPPTPPPPPTNGHTPRWATREDAVDAYIFYTTKLGQYITEPAALVRAVNCLVMQEANGEINLVNRKAG